MVMDDATEVTVARRVTIVNERGLHARAAAKFVRLAGTFRAEITVAKKDVEVSGSSIMGLMMLAAAPGCGLDLRASGPGAEEAVSALADLVANRFDEDG
jgi:phosphocarrier protein